MTRSAKRNHNRIAAVMLHCPKYWEHGQQILAKDAGISVSALARLMLGQSGSQHWVVARVATALEKAIGRPIDTRELVSEDGEYPTRFVCQLVGCQGCLPKQAFDKRGRVVTAYRGVTPGCWTGDNYEIPTGENKQTKEVNE